MQVIHLDAGRSMRGGQWQALYLIEELRRREYAIELLCPHQSPLELESRRRGIVTRPLSLAAVWSASSHADLLHIHDSRSHSLAALASRCPFVASRRVAFPVNRGPISRWKYGRAAHYLAVSAFVRNMLTQAGVPESKIAIVPDGVPLPSIDRTVDLPFRLVAIDFEDPRKGTALARESAQLAGAPITFTRDLERDLASATALLYLTYSEGLGSAILMAMARGIPVIASRVGGIPEIVEHGETGLLVENRPADVAAAIARLHADQEFVTTLGRNARRTVESGFTPLHTAEKTVRIYQQVLS